MSDKEKGYFVCIEGIDGTGKTTFINNFQKNNKDKVVTTRMPGGTDFAESLREYARNADVSPLSQLLTYSACINDCLENTVAPALDKGKIVVSDRSYLSTYAYQVCMNKSLLLPLYTEILKATTIKPDLIIYIDIDPQVAMERELAADRGSSSIDRYSKLQTEEKLTIYRNYQYLVNNPQLPIHGLLTDYQPGTSGIIRINGNCCADELYRRIDHVVSTEMKCKLSLSPV